jgi:hypothetical protein
LVQGRLVRTLTTCSAPTGEVHDGEIENMSECLPMASLLPLGPVVSATLLWQLVNQDTTVTR